MIVNFLCEMLIGFITWAVGFLPNYTGLPAGVVSAFSFIKTYLGYASSIFPIDTALQILLIVIPIQIAVWIWEMFWWFYDKMPGKFS